MMIVVSDTSPFNYLVQIGHVDLLPSLYKRVVTAPAVIEELLHVRGRETVRTWAQQPPDWLDIRSPRSVAPSLGKDRGEAAAIALAIELHADTVLMDDLGGRILAQQHGLHVQGTLAVLVRGGEKGLIDFRKAFDALLRTNFRISPAIVEQIRHRHD